MTNLTDQLDRLRDVGAFPNIGHVRVRWGQLLREEPALAAEIRARAAAGSLAYLAELANIRSGVVTRANAYFIVRELPFDAVPKRFHFSRRDLTSSAVVLDGVDTPFRIERQWLRPVVRGPEDLLSPHDVASSAARLFDVTASREELRETMQTGALEYLRRGETFAYSVSDDDLKGGIPAERAQIKNRRPFWYSLHVPNSTSPRIIVPEHYHRRYIATLLASDDQHVVNDTLYTVLPSDPSHARLIHLSINSLLSWYQIELRGRTQHGEGVLKAKIPDFEGMLVLKPTAITTSEADRLDAAFRALDGHDFADSLTHLSEPQRVVFDELYLELCRFENPAGMRLMLERALRSAVSERFERRASVSAAKTERRRINVTATVDSYATRIAASMDQYPDPRSFLITGETAGMAVVLAKPDGTIRVGEDLFNQSEVFSGSTIILSTPHNLAARFARLLLLRDPDLQQVNFPPDEELRSAMDQFENAAKTWMKRFGNASRLALQNVTDERLSQAIEDRALRLLHAK
ncbi:MAG: hypothetical protein IT535_05430 [Bauldia sp.]|nr:hypothetical protein [Bauldia sp.]